MLGYSQVAIDSIFVEIFYLYSGREVPFGRLDGWWATLYNGWNVQNTEQRYGF